MMVITIIDQNYHDYDFCHNRAALFLVMELRGSENVAEGRDRGGMGKSRTSRADFVMNTLVRKQ